jgi:putative membrane protein
MKRDLISPVAMAMVLSATIAVAAPSREDFLKDAIRGDNSEIKLGQLAARNGGSRELREYGRTLVSDHVKAKAQAARLAGQLHIEVPARAMLKADAEYLKLRVLSGKNFDREFVGYMVEDHKQDIRDFTETARAHHGPVAELAAKQLPTLRKHLRIAERLGSSI